MRNEEAIRKHLDDLRWAREQPCDCAGTVHQMQCRDGDLMMAAGRAQGGGL